VLSIGKLKLHGEEAEHLQLRCRKFRALELISLVNDENEPVLWLWFSLLVSIQTAIERLKALSIDQ